MRTRAALLAACLLAVLPSASRPAAAQAVDPPARNPPPPSVPPPVAAPADPAAPPPAREPVPAEPAEPAPIAYPYAEPLEPVNPGEPLPVEPGPLVEKPADEKPAVSAPAAVAPAPAEPVAKAPGADPGEKLAAAPLQERTETLLPATTIEDQHLAGYQAALKGETESALEHYEKALAGEPDNLRWGAEYRQVVIASGKYSRGARFLGRLAKDHPDAANLHLNLGYAGIDQVPVAGPLAQMGLAGDAVREFSAALEIEESWLGYFSRGSAYVFYPPVFGKANLGVADLERAIDLAAGEPPRTYHAHAWAALGDGFWRLGQRDAMRSAWRRGLALFPGSAELQERLAQSNDAELDAWLQGIYSPGRRIDTRLEELWQALRDEAP